MKAIQKINQIIVFSVLLLSFGYANPKEKDFVVDCDKCVIEVSFTEEEVERFKKEMGEDNFYDAADDANYYSYTLRKYLEVNGVESKHISRLECLIQSLFFHMYQTHKNKSMLILISQIQNILKKMNNSMLNTK